MPTKLHVICKLCLIVSIFVEVECHCGRVLEVRDDYRELLAQTCRKSPILWCIWWCQLGRWSARSPAARTTSGTPHTGGRTHTASNESDMGEKKKKKKKNTCKLSHTTTQYSDSCVSEDLICIIGPTDCMSASKLYYTHTVSHALNAVPPLSLIRSAMCVLSKDQANMCATKVMKEGQNSKGRRLSLPHFEVILAL